MKMAKDDNNKSKRQWWKEPEYAKYNIDGSEDYWLPPQQVDPVKLQPKQLSSDECEQIRTALDTLRKYAEKMSPKKLKEIIGAVEVSKKEELPVTSPSPPPIYRKQPHGDTWGCRDCNDRGDKWYMQDHLCRRFKMKRVGSSVMDNRTATNRKEGKQ
jgi:hypothetical protein